MIRIWFCTIYKYNLLIYSPKISLKYPMFLYGLSIFIYQFYVLELPIILFWGASHLQITFNRLQMIMKCFNIFKFSKQ